MVALKRSALDLLNRDERGAFIVCKTPLLFFCRISQVALHQLHIFQWLQDFVLMQKGCTVPIFKDEIGFRKSSRQHHTPLQRI